jgi:peptidoglycan/LPS O-acetylase OafA/YrhL
MSQVDSVSPVQGVRGQRAAKTGFRPDIEGLRAVAVVAVVLFHAGVPGVGGGFIGVDVFFVISGFLITGMLWREVSTTGGVRLGLFYGARARRLLPASAAVGVVTAIGSAILLSPLELRGVLGDGIACALYVGNYRFAQQGIDYLASDRPPSPFQHYWSLGVEEQFYLIWPPLIIATAWLILRARRRASHAATSTSTTPYLMVLALVAAISFTASVITTRVAAPVAFFWLPTRAWQLAAGGLIALTATQWRRLPAIAAAIAGWTGLAVILVACTRLGAATPYPGTAALLPVLGAALVIGAGCATPTLGCGRVLATPPMRAIGRVSYSWYLWHWPVLLLAPALLGHPLGLAERLAAAAVSAGLAVLTLRLIENPIRFAAPLHRSATASLAVGALATAVAVCVNIVLLIAVPAPVGRSLAAQTLTITEGPPLVGGTIDQYNAIVQHDFAQVQAAVAASAALDDVPANLDPPLADAPAEGKRILYDGCLRNFLVSGQPECAMGDTASTTTMALIGDSAAAMWTPGFQQVAAHRHWRLEMLTRAGCPMLDVPTINPATHTDYTECDQWRAEIVARLQSEHPRLIVLGMSRGYGPPGSIIRADFTSYDQTWIGSLAPLVRQLRDTGAQVLVLGPIPDPQSVVPTCLSVHLSDATACSPLRSVAVNEPGIAAETAATKAGGGQYADLTALFCTAERCPVIVGNALVYWNRGHIGVEYSRLLAPVLGALADRALVGG